MLDGRTRRLALIALAAICLLLLALAPAAMGDALTPESGGGSSNAEDIDTLYKVTLYIALVIFLIVEGTLIWSIVRYRARRGGEEPAQIRGNTPLEVGWTVGAALILVVLTLVTFLYLNGIKNPPASPADGLRADSAQFAAVDQPNPPKGGGRALNIRVNGQQYLWRFEYPGSPTLFNYYEMVVPTNTTITLDVTASDVIHSWWIPKLGGKVDGTPGHNNETWFKVEEPGVYRGQCAELCGAGHADMRAVVRAVSPAEFEAWAARQREDIEAAQRALTRQRTARERRSEIR